MESEAYRPVWPGSPFEGWARNYVKSNYWRVKHLGDYDDAMQECALTFSRCCKYYVGKVDNPKWFMSLYTRAVINDFATLAAKDGHAHAARIDLVAATRAQSLVAHSDGPLLAALQGASQELRTVMAVVAAAPAELLTLLLDNTKDEKRWNRRLQRLCGIKNVSTDIIGELRSILEK